MAPVSQEDFDAAVSELTADDYAKGGEPLMDPLNKALVAAGHEAIKGDQRDTLWQAHTAALESAEGDDTDAPDPTTVDLTVTKSAADPLVGYVHGVGPYRLPVGERQTVSIEIHEVLAGAADVEIEVHDG